MQRVRDASGYGGRTVELRTYQQKTIDLLYEWLRSHKGNPCIVLPTGAGKSVILSALCSDAIRRKPNMRILMTTHQKELIEQDRDALLRLDPSADVGVFSASVGEKETSHQITFCGIQSVFRHYADFGKVDLIIVDEAHTINAKAEGMYRQFIAGLQQSNENLVVVGLTATPFRLGHGMITDKPAIFDEPLIEPVTIAELQGMGYLARLTSKCTGAKVDADGVALSGGDYNQKALQEAVDIPGLTDAVVSETIARAGGRKSWLFFCSGVEHALHVRGLLREKGISAETVTGATPKAERERILSEFKEGHITAVTNANVLTTGFDNPRIDLICLMRPTLSPGLYVQMVGRGLRTFPEKENCLILDFAGNVERHGPIHEVRKPTKKKGKNGVAPSKTCPKCLEIVSILARTCPCCGYEFPRDELKEKEFQLSDADINGNSYMQLDISWWHWGETTSRNGNRMLAVTYYPKSFAKPPVTEYFVLEHKSDHFIAMTQSRIAKRIAQAGGMLADALAESGYDIRYLNGLQSPSRILAKKEGRYWQFCGAVWD